MNAAYRDIIAASDNDRRDLFLTTANRLNTTLQNIEKDFWVCWTLDALFHRLPKGGPRFLFKGGTSLSKGYDLISRFSEDIDITVFREDIGVAGAAEDLEKLTKTSRRKRLEAIKDACAAFINGPLMTALSDLGRQTMANVGQDPKRFAVAPDDDDVDHQTLLIRYPSVVTGDAGYVAPVIKIESGAKSALDPNESRQITPYLAADYPAGEALAIPGITTIDPARTFLDKILILHGQPIYFEKHKRFYGSGQISRHYYDVHRVIAGPVGKKASSDEALVVDCLRHARMFFYRKDTGLEDVARGSFRLKPSDAMLSALRRDYEDMATMIFGDVPSFDEVIESVMEAEALLNAATTVSGARRN